MKFSRDSVAARYRHSRSVFDRRTLRPSVEVLENRLVLAGLSLADYYTEGKGSGLGFQELDGFGLVTTYETFIGGSTSNSALEGRPADHASGESPLREGFEFNPAFVFDDPTGNLAGWHVERGGTAPWLIRQELVGTPGAAADLEFPKLNYPDSAATATTLYSGVKTYNNAMGVDIFEQPVETILEVAQRLGKSTGAVSSVPLDHATPGAAVAHHNTRVNRDVEFPDLDNTLQQALLQLKPTVLMGGGHPIFGSEAYVKLSTLTALRDPADGLYDDWTFIERGPNATERLAEVASRMSAEAGDRLVGVFGARGQSGNLPWSTADGDFSHTGLSGRRDLFRPLQVDETHEAFIARERNENPRLFELTDAALDVLEDDPEGFWLVVEGGDIDWAMHDNNIDNAIGTVLEFDLAVQGVVNWIEQNGGFDENLLIVTADHDHYLTLNHDYPALVSTRGVQALTPIDSTDVTGDPESNGHFWGSNPNNQFGWRSHTSIPVPVYYDGPDAITSMLDNSVGTGFTAYGHPVPGIEGMMDQVHIFEAMNAAFTTGQAKNVVIMIGDGMGWEMARAAAIATQVEPATNVQAVVDGGVLTLIGTQGVDLLQVQEQGTRLSVASPTGLIQIQTGDRTVDHVDISTVTNVSLYGWNRNDRVSLAGVSLDIFGPGDVNQDLRFDQIDIIFLLLAGKYRTGEPATWAEGDFTGDGIFDQLDIVAALQSGDYLR